MFPVEVLRPVCGSRISLESEDRRSDLSEPGPSSFMDGDLFGSPESLRGFSFLAVDGVFCGF